MAKVLRVDTKKRITLGNLALGVSSYEVEQRGANLILHPRVEVPAQEAWIYKNPTVIDSIRKGLQDAKNGKTKPVRSFAKHADEDID